MADVLTFLNSHTEPWQSFGSIFLDVDPNCTCLSVLGLFLLYLCYLLLKPFFSTMRGSEDNQKHQGRPKRRRRTFGGQRTCLRETDERRKLLSTLKSFPGQHYDSTDFRQLLCPYPLCEVCNRATAEVSHLLSLSSMEDAAPDQSLLISTGKMLESRADQQGSSVTLPFEKSRGEPEEQHVHPYLKTFEDHLHQQYIQLLCGIPSPHSKSLNPNVPFSCDRSLSFVCFSTISEASSAHESPVLLQPLPVSLPETQPGPLSQTLPQSQSQHLPPAQPQAQLQSPVADPPHVPELFHQGPHCEAIPITPIEIQWLEYHVLQKNQEDTWGLPMVVQTSQKSFCPPAPSISSVRVSSKAHAPISILPGDLPLQSEIRRKLEHHLRKRLIQHRWGLPRRILESLSLISPQSDAPEFPVSKRSSKLSWISFFKGQKSTDVKNVGLSQTGRFLERSSEMPALEEGVGKEQGLSDSEGSLDYSLGSNSETDLESDLWSLSRKCSKASEMSPCQKQLENALQVHLSQKWEEIIECQVPDPVRSSWRALKVPLPEKSPSQMKHCDLGPVLGKDNCLHSTQDISFLDATQKEILEDHVKSFNQRMMFGLPSMVQESMEIYNMKEDPSQSFSPSTFPSFATPISGVDSNHGLFKSLRRNSSVFDGHKEETKCSVPILDDPLPPASPSGKEGQGVLTQSPSAIKTEHVEDLHKMKGGRWPSLHQTHSVTDRDGQQQFVAGNGHTARPPTSQAETVLEPEKMDLSSSNGVQRPQGNRINCGKFSTCNESREIYKAEEFLEIQSQPSDVMTTSDFQSSPGTGTNVSKAEMTLTSGSPPPGGAAPHNPEAAALKQQVCNELKHKSESRKDSQDPGLAPSGPLASGNLASKVLLTHGQGVSSGDGAASQVLHIYCENREMSMEQGQLPFVPAPVSCDCGNKHSPPAIKSMCYLALKGGDPGGGDAELGASHPKRDSYPAQDRTLVETHESNSPPALSPKEQPPPEDSFRNPMKHFLQWFCPGTKCKRQECSLEKGSSPSSSVPARGLVKGRTAFTGNMDNQKVRTDTGNVLQEKLGGRRGVEKTCLDERLAFSMKPGKTQHKAELQGRLELVQGQSFKYKAPCSQVTSATSYSKEAAIAGQSYHGRNPQIRARERQTPKVVAYKDPRYLPSVLPREAGPNPSPTGRPQVGPLAPGYSDHS